MATEISSGADPSLLRRLNAELALRTLRGSEAMTLAEVARIAGLARSTTAEVLGDLVAAGIVAEEQPSGSGQGRSGRPARRFKFRADAGYVAGVGIDATHTRVVLCDLAGTAVASTNSEFTPRQANSPIKIAQHAVNECLRLAALRPRLLCAAAVGIPGVVGSKGDILMSLGQPDWVGVDMAVGLTQELGCPALVENRGRMAVLGEVWKGLGDGVQDMLFVHAGERNGVGVIAGGALLQGRNGAAGEIGHHPLLSWAGQKSYRDELATLFPGLDIEQAAKAAFAAAATTPAADDLVRRYVRDLSHGIAALVLTLDPELVVLGGPIAEGGPAILELLRTNIDEVSLFPPKVRFSTLGDDVVALGAARRALTHVEENLLGLKNR